MHMAARNVEAGYALAREIYASYGVDTDAAVAKLAHEGFDPDFGARPLKRVIQRRLSDPLANLVLEGKLGEGDSVVVDVAGGELTLRPKRG